jgi:hypothetical protein
MGGCVGQSEFFRGIDSDRTDFARSLNDNHSGLVRMSRPGDENSFRPLSEKRTKGELGVQLMPRCSPLQFCHEGIKKLSARGRKEEKSGMKRTA